MHEYFVKLAKIIYAVDTINITVDVKRAFFTKTVHQWMKEVYVTNTALSSIVQLSSVLQVDSWRHKGQQLCTEQKNSTAWI